MITRKIINTCGFNLGRDALNNGIKQRVQKHFMHMRQLEYYRDDVRIEGKDGLFN
jgi:hypothetical protein